MRALLAAILAVFAPPASATMLLLGAGPSSDGPSYVPPALVSPYAIALGDSITQGVGGMSNPGYGGPVTISAPLGSGYLGWLAPLSDNRFLLAPGYNYGVSGQTTGGIAGRINRSGVDCFGGGCSYGGMFTGWTATASASTTGGAGGVETFTIASIAGTTPAVGDAVAAASNCKITAPSSISNSVTVTVAPLSTGDCVLSGSITGSAPLRISEWWRYGGDLGHSDQMNSIVSGGVNTPANDPAQVVFALGGGNDSGFPGAGTTAAGSIANLTTIVNAFGPAAGGGVNKYLILGDGTPRGLATGCSAQAASGGVCTGGSDGAPETHTIPDATTCGTAANCKIKVNSPALYYDTAEVFFAPCGSAGAGSSLNKQGTGSGVSGDAYDCATTTPTTPWSPGISGDGIVLAPVGSSPAAGQYVAASDGTITFNGADAGKRVGVWYRYQAGVAGSKWQDAIHDWVSSTSCAGSTGALSGYSIPAGAKCKSLYPGATIAPFWSALVDPNPATIGPLAGTGNADLPKAFVSPDGVHPGPYGSQLVAGAAVTAAAGAGAEMASSPFSLPTRNNFTFAGNIFGPGTPTNIPSTICGDADKSFWIQPWMDGRTPALSLTDPRGLPVWGTASAPASGAVLGGAGAPIWRGTNLGAGTRVVCIDPSVPGYGVMLKLNKAAPSYYANTGIFYQVDGGTFFTPGGVFDHANAFFTTTNDLGACTLSAHALCSSPTGTVGGINLTALFGGAAPTLPTQFVATLDSGSKTAIQNGTLGFSYGVASNPFGDNYDYAVVQLQGVAGATAPSIALGIGSPLIGATLTQSYTRAVCDVRVGPGPNGRLYGLTGVDVSALNSFSGNITLPPWTDTPSTVSAKPTAYTKATTYPGLVSWNDAMVAPGAPHVASGLLSMQIVSPPAPISGLGVSLTGVGATATVSWLVGEPVSATVFIGRCGLFGSNQ